MPDYPEYSTLKEIAALMNRRPATVSKHIANGKVPRSLSAIVKAADGKMRRQWRTAETIQALQQNTLAGYDSHANRSRRPQPETPADEYPEGAAIELDSLAAYDLQLKYYRVMKLQLDAETLQGKWLDKKLLFEDFANIIRSCRDGYFRAAEYLAYAAEGKNQEEMGAMIKDEFNRFLPDPDNLEPLCPLAMADLEKKKRRIMRRSR